MKKYSFLLFFLLIGVIHGAIPEYISIKGVIRKEGAVINGRHDLIINLMSSQNVVLWSEVYPQLLFLGGEFSITLGKKTPLKASFFDSQTFLEFHLNEARIQNPLLSVPYAFRSEMAKTAESIDWSSITGKPKEKTLGELTGTLNAGHIPKLLIQSDMIHSVDSKKIVGSVQMADTDISSAVSRLGFLKQSSSENTPNHFVVLENVSINNQTASGLAVKSDGGQTIGVFCSVKDENGRKRIELGSQSDHDTILVRNKKPVLTLTGTEASLSDGFRFSGNGALLRNIPSSAITGTFPYTSLSISKSDLTKLGLADQEAIPSENTILSVVQKAALSADNLKTGTLSSSVFAKGIISNDMLASGIDGSKIIGTLQADVKANTLDNSHIKDTAKIQFSKLAITKSDITGLGLPAEDTRLTDSDIAKMGYLKSVSNAHIASDAKIDFSKLALSKEHITGLGIPAQDTRLSQSEVGQYATNEGFQKTAVADTKYIPKSGESLTSKFTFKFQPTGSSIDSGSIYIGPDVADTDQTLFGIGLGTNKNSRFRVDAEGDVFIAGTIQAQNYFPNNWNMAYAWGYHGDQGYLKSVTNAAVASDAKISFSKLDIQKVHLTTLGVADSDHTHDGRYHLKSDWDSFYNALGSTGTTAHTSGASLIKVYDEFTYSDAATVQGILKNFDTALSGKEPSFPKNSAFNKNFGSVSETVAAGNHTHDTRYYTNSQTDARYLQIANNLSDLQNTATARTNLGLGTLAVQNAADVTMSKLTLNPGSAYIHTLTVETLNYANTGVTNGSNVDMKPLDSNGTVIKGFKKRVFKAVGLNLPNTSTVTLSTNLELPKVEILSVEIVILNNDNLPYPIDYVEHFGDSNFRNPINTRSGDSVHVYKNWTSNPYPGDEMGYLYFETKSAAPIKNARWMPGKMGDPKYLQFMISIRDNGFFKSSVFSSAKVLAIVSYIE